MIITDPNARLARHDEKRQLVMSFLRHEIWSTPAVIGELIQVSDKSSISRLLKSLEKDQLVRLDRVDVGTRPQLMVGATALSDRSSVMRLLKSLEKDKLVKLDRVGIGKRSQMVARITSHDGARTQLIAGITPHGQAIAARGEGNELFERTYEATRVPKTMFFHTLDLQRLRIRCERAGWRQWRSADHVAPGELGRSPDKRPDALAVHPRLGLLAIECERTIKTKKRYQAIIKSHLTQIHRHGAFHGVVYACPTPTIAAALEAIINRIEFADRGLNLRFDLEGRPLLHIVDYEHIAGL